MRAMQADFSRNQAADILLGRLQPDRERFSEIPAFLRARTARREAVRLLAEVDRPSALELGALMHAATIDSDVQVRVLAVAALGRCAPPAVAAPVLIACSTDREPVVRDAAEEALLQLEYGEARISLVRTQSEPGGPDRSRAHSSPVADPQKPTKEPAFIGH
jgi:HEAT repeat protein